jgi:hypothetical protein
MNRRKLLGGIALGSLGTLTVTEAATGRLYPRQERAHWEECNPNDPHVGYVVSFIHDNEEYSFVMWKYKDWMSGMAYALPMFEETKPTRYLNTTAWKESWTEIRIWSHLHTQAEQYFHESIGGQLPRFDVYVDRSGERGS